MSIAEKGYGNGWVGCLTGMLVGTCVLGLIYGLGAVLSFLIGPFGGWLQWLFDSIILYWQRLLSHLPS